jgi:hypothetical protein
MYLLWVFFHDYFLILLMMMLLRYLHNYDNDDDAKLITLLQGMLQNLYYIRISKKAEVKNKIKI